MYIMLEVADPVCNAKKWLLLYIKLKWVLLYVMLKLATPVCTVILRTVANAKCNVKSGRSCMYVHTAKSGHFCM
jgi:hypothetical protein